jgi:hypothetical protein
VKIKENEIKKPIRDYINIRGQSRQEKNADRSGGREMTSNEESLLVSTTANKLILFVL